MSHKVFISIHWSKINNKSLPPPYTPSQFLDFPQYEKYELAKNIIKETPRDKKNLYVLLF